MKISQKTITSQGAKLIIINNKKQELGHAYLYYLRNELHKRPLAIIEDLFIELEYRKQGLGTKLVKKIITLAKEKDCYKLIATSRDSRTKIHNWYKKMGFEDYGKEFRIDFE